MPYYEVWMIATKVAPPNYLVKLFRKCGETLANSGGLIRGIDHIGLRPLAYPMRAHAKKNEYGRYIRLRIQASPFGLEEFSTRLRNDEEVVRFMPIKQRTIAPKQDFVIPKRTYRRSPFTEPEGYYIRKNSDLDYFAARTLLKAGKISRDEVINLGRWHDRPNAEELNEAVDIPDTEIKPESTITSKSQYRRLFEMMREDLTVVETDLEVKRKSVIANNILKRYQYAMSNNIHYDKVQDEQYLSQEEIDEMNALDEQSKLADGPPDAETAGEEESSGDDASESDEKSSK